MRLSRWVSAALAILCLTGCGARKYDPYGQQVQRAADLSRQGEQWYSQGDWDRAARDFGRSLEVSRAVDNPPGVARQLNNLGAVALEQGDLGKANQLFTQAWEINQTQGNWSEGSVNQANLATVAQRAGRWQDAAQHLQLAQDAAQKTQSPLARARVHLRWAGFHLDQHNLASAAASLAEAAGLASTPALQGALAYQRGRLLLARGDTAGALAQFHLALNFDKQVLDRPAIAADLFGLGETYQIRGEMPQAWDHFSRAFEVYAALGKKDQARRCLARLAEANTRGQLGRSLVRFQKHPLLSEETQKPATAATSPKFPYPSPRGGPNPP